MGNPPVHAATYFRGWLRVNLDSPVGKPWRDRQIPGQRWRAGIRDSGSMMDQTSQKIRAIRDRLHTLLVLLLKL
jgi:hypothetical protein